jgi:hypothetical protein
MSGSSTVLAVNGVALPIEDLQVTIGYDGSFVSTLTVTYNGLDYVQTISNDGTNITAISQWVPAI